MINPFVGCLDFHSATPCPHEVFGYTENTFHYNRGLSRSENKNYGTVVEIILEWCCISITDWPYMCVIRFINSRRFRGGISLLIHTHGVKISPEPIH